MPYAVRKRGDKYVVINKETGDVKGTHSTAKKAHIQKWIIEKATEDEKK